MKNQDKIEKIEFSENWNHKLLNDLFTTIRPATKKYNLEDKYAIYLRDRFFCYANIVAIEKLTINEIISRNIHLTDTGKTEKGFIDLMKVFYKNKTWWKDEETHMIVLYIKKIIQTDLFDQIPENESKD